MPRSGLRCFTCRAEFEHGLYAAGCPACGDPLEVVYRYGGALEGADVGVWRYAPVLPVEDERFRISLGEGNTPLVRVTGTPENFWFKNETANPTWSFKDRFHAVSLSVGRMLGYRRVIASTTGNHGASVAAYAAAARMRCVVFCHREAPLLQRRMIGMYGALPVILEPRQALLERFVREHHCWPSTTMAPLPVANAYGVEGYKTIAYEICRQLGRVPDHMVCPVAAGDALYGPWKGFCELRQLGLTDRTPAMYGAQAAGCNPYVQSFEQGLDHVIVHSAPQSIALSIRDETGGYPALQAMRDSGGRALEASEEEIRAAVRRLAAGGILVEPASAAALACALKAGFPDGETVVCLLTGSGAKWPETLESLYEGPLLENPSVREVEVWLD
jgi:threonine synthase